MLRFTLNFNYMISWVSVEEAALRYGMPAENRPAWLEKEKIPYIELNGVLFVDEGRLEQHAAYDRLCAAPPEPDSPDAYDESVRELKNELLFHLHLMEPGSPLHRLFADELRRLVSSDDDRDIFNYVIYPSPHLYEFFRRRGISYDKISKIYRKCIRDITRKLQLLQRSRHVEAMYKYELRVRNRMIDRYEEEVGRLGKKSRKKATAVPEEVAKRLSVPLEELGLPTRVLTGCRLAGLATVGDLLWKARNEGLTSLMSSSYFGRMTFRQLEIRLQQAGILDEAGDSELFFYLKAWRASRGGG